MKTSGKGQGRPMRIEPSQSPSWRAAVLAIHALAIAGISFADISLLWWLSGSLAIGSNLIWECRRGIPPSGSPRIHAAVLNSDGHWMLETPRGVMAADLLSSSRFWPRVLVLRFRAEGRRLWWLLPADALPCEDFRRLQTRLRHEY